MASLIGLPMEMNFKVSSYLNVPDRCRLSRTCKALRYVIEPTVYQKIELRWGPIRWYKPLQNGDRIHLLLRTFLRRPELASYVRRAVFLANQGESIALSEDKLTPAELQSAKDLVCAMGLPSSEHWVDALNKGDPNVFVALLLLQFSNLRALIVLGPKLTKPFFLGEVFLHALRPASIEGLASRFQCLKYISYLDIGTFYESDPPHWGFLPFFYFPCIRTIDAKIFESAYGFWLSDRSLPHAASLERLDISGDGRGGSVCPETLVKLLSTTSKLRCLCYEFGQGRGGHDDSYFSKSIDQLRQAVTQVKPTIRDIRIRFNIPTSRVSSPDIRTIGSFQDFPHLTKLDITLILLLGGSLDKLLSGLADMLPPTLRKLQLAYPIEAGLPRSPWRGKNLFELFRDYLRNRKAHAPALKHIDLSILFHRDPMFWGEGSYKGLNKVCKRAGIKLEVH
ncbi:hypothetical protein MMC20_006626 [Loxospora ochrophaea]|nr:hypothetical protein [Loxospora ochrophaea]